MSSYIDFLKKVVTGTYSGHKDFYVIKHINNNIYKEGDIWEENGKTWTIKDGIKQTISPMDMYRLEINMPISCPVCHRNMNKRLDRRMWVLRRKCFDCVIEEDNQRIIDGTFQEYEKETMSRTAKSFYTDLKEMVHDYIDSNDMKHYVTEAGEIENWDNPYSKEQLKEMFDKQLDEFATNNKELLNDK